MFFNSYLEKMLIENGYDRFSLAEKNALITELANRNKLSFLEVNEEYILNHHKTLKIEMFKEICETDIEKGFTATNGHFYRTNRDDQINMIGQKDLLNSMPTIESVMWKTEDAGYIEHTKAEWLDIYTQAFMHKQETLFKYDSLKKNIMLATTHAEIMSMTWEEESTTIVE
jgi:hypothetical protein